MVATEKFEARSRLVLVVGVDLSDISAHLLSTARSLVRSVDEAELHVVHVVPPEPLVQRLAEPTGAQGVVERSQAESARFELQRLCGAVTQGVATRVVVHTPVGHPAKEIIRIASEVGAGIIVIEAHDPPLPRRLLHRSVVARIARTAPCSVLTVRPGPAARPTKDAVFQGNGAGPAPPDTPAARTST